MYYEQKQLKSDIKIFVMIVAILVTIGLLFIYSSSSVYAVELYGSAHYFVKKQFLGLIIGIVALLFFRFIPLSFLEKTSGIFFGSSLVLTALTLVPQLSRNMHGSSRWLKLGPLSMQPSELLKLSFILYCAHLLAKKEFDLKSFTRTYLPYMAIVGITSVILLQQPDFGMAITLAATAFILLYVMHVPTMHLLLTVGALLGSAIVLIALKPYRLRRIVTFLNPWDDPQGAGFQIIQSLIAIGAGSFLGAGVAQSKQKFFYLPMQHTDFIFSIIAEETGFVGCTFLIALYILFLYFGLRIASMLTSTFSSLTTLGFVLLISLQALINGAVVTGLVPTKGVGLPFVSYGNSALICSLAMVGIIMNCVNSARSYS